MTRITRIRNFIVDVGLAIGEGTPEGDAAFRKAIFGDTSQTNASRAAGPQRISDRAALSLGSAFLAKSGSIGATVPFAHMCLEHGRIDLLREVLAAERPKVVQDRGGPRNVESASDWLAFLRTKETESWGRFAYSLVIAATTPMSPHARDFVEVVLEMGNEQDTIRSLLKSGGPTAALITEAQMRLRMREVQATTADTSADSQAMPTTTPSHEGRSTRRRSVSV